MHAGASIANGPRVDNVAPARPEKVGQHAAWAMAVGGMIGGGIYTLAGVLLGAAGSLAWVSLALGAVIALITVRSYARLTLAGGGDVVPVSLFAREGKRRLARVMAVALVL